MAGEKADIPLIIGGKEIRTGQTQQAVMPHNHAHVLADWHMAEPDHVAAAIAARAAAEREWASWAWHERAAVFLRAAELLNTTWRATLNAATMLGQSKTVFQAEIDAAAESVDFWRFNAHFAQELYGEQPLSTPAAWNMVEYRPLEGFVFAVTPFNFTSIAANLPTAPALLGNTVVWKPASTAILSGYYLMRLLEAAGLPPGVINFVPGDAAMISSSRAGVARPGGRAFHRQHGGVQRDVAQGRRQRRQLPLLSATGRRDRRQGLHPRPRVGRPAGARRCDRARRLRVPGSEVLRLQPYLRAGLALARRTRSRRRHDAADARSATWPTSAPSAAP